MTVIVLQKNLTQVLIHRGKLSTTEPHSNKDLLISRYHFKCFTTIYFLLTAIQEIGVLLLFLS